jgi:hypothetical protein
VYPILTKELQQTIQIKYFSPEWFAGRRQLVHSLAPTDPAILLKQEEQAVKLLLNFNKQVHYQGIKDLEWNNDAFTLASKYLKFKQKLYILFMIDMNTQLILDRDGIVKYDSNVAWYTLKATANFILSRMTDSKK